MCEVGIRLRREKCRFFESEIEHLGHVVNEHGVRPNPKKAEAIRRAPAPKDKQALESRLCTAQYYADFIPGFASLAGPLNELRRKGVQYKWTPECQAAFDAIKSELAVQTTRVHFDECRPLILATDASPYGVGAVLLQKLDDGREHMVTCTSRTLSSAERNYSLIEKEALGIVFGLKRLRQFVAGREVQLYTDHKPLTFIYKPDAAISPTALQRIQRWSLFLANFNYIIQHRPGKLNCQADALSRSPQPVSADVDVDIEAIHLFQVESGPTGAIGVQQVRQATRRDPQLARVIEFVIRGWPMICPCEELRSFYTHRNELTVESGVLLWGMRVVVPTSLRHTVLEQLHESHPGVTRCKQLARSYVWWPCIDADIEHLVQACEDCAEQRRDPNAPALGRWEFASHAFHRVHIDHAGLFLGHYWLVWVDAFSKYAGVHRVSRPDSTTTISTLREVFGYFGLPDQIVSDNGPAFIGEEFQEFLRSNGIQHVRSSPYHPQTNGETERFVQTFKKALKVGVKRSTDAELDQRLQQFLLKYRVTPHATTARSPAEMFVGCRPTTVLDRLRPDLRNEVEQR